MSFLTTNQISDTDKVAVIEGENLDSCLFCQVDLTPRSNRYRLYYFKRYKQVRPYYRLMECRNPGQSVDNVCGLVFKDFNKLFDHLRSHTSERPFQCPGCNMSFAQNSNLLRHQRSKHPVKNI